jgi:hypothetical protein
MMTLESSPPSHKQRGEINAKSAGCIRDRVALVTVTEAGYELEHDLLQTEHQKEAHAGQQLRERIVRFYP